MFFTEGPLTPGTLRFRRYTQTPEVGTLSPGKGGGSNRGTRSVRSKRRGTGTVPGAERLRPLEGESNSLGQSG